MVVIDFMPIDYDSFDFEGRNYIKVTGKTSQEKRAVVIDKCDVYFWAILKEKISDKKAEEVAKELLEITIKDDSRPAKVIKTEIKSKKFLGKEIKVIKIFISNHKDAGKLSEKISKEYDKEIEKIRELDINYITRYIMEKQLIPSYWYKLEGEEISNSGEFGSIGSGLDADIIIKAEKITKLESEKTNEKLFIPKILAFDLETDDFEIGKGKILMISLVSEGFKKVLTCKKIPSMPDYVECYSNETDMIEDFIKYFKKVNPDVLTGYFSDGFDLPYLKSRCEKLKIKLSLGIDNSIPKFSGGVNPKGRISGITHIDLYQFIETAYSQYLQSETLGLGDVANELLGEKKVVHEFKRSEKMKEEEWRNFFEYNLQDAVLTYKLFMKSWPDMVEFSKLMQEPLFNISRDGMSANVEHYIIHNLYKYNEIAERKPLHDEISQRRSREKYEGAFVLQPIPKLYENIVMFDFTSYWPSIISTFNLSRSTFLGEKSDKLIKDKGKNALEVDTGKNKYFFTKEKGFFPQMLEEVIKLRKQYKVEYKSHPSPILKARSNAFKLIANASYGYQGFFGARYYCPEASASATAISRKFMKEVIEKAEKSGFKAIYSDTDSLSLEIGKKTNSQALEFLKKINSELPGIMELELEDFYKRGIWVTTRKGEFGAKKKYALINHEGKLKIRGFETVRRDWCNLARELQNKVLEKILKDGNEKAALELTKQLIKQIKERKIEKNKIIIRTQLKKPLSEYKAVTPHVTIARKMLAEGMPVNQGMLIEYYIAESDNKKALKRDRAFLPDETKPYDIDYYLKNQVLPAVENIFQVFNINVNDLIEKQAKNQKSLAEF